MATSSAGGASERLERQFRFLTEIDGLKRVERQNILCDGSRRENLARALDCVQPAVLHEATDGIVWHRHGTTRDQIQTSERHTRERPGATKRRILP